MKKITKKMIKNAIEKYSQLLHYLESDYQNVDNYIYQNYLNAGLCFFFSINYKINYETTNDKINGFQEVMFMCANDKEEKVKVTKERIKLLKSLI